MKKSEELKIWQQLYNRLAEDQDTEDALNEIQNESGIKWTRGGWRKVDPQQFLIWKMKL